jgi:hypothetical protein
MVYFYIQHKVINSRDTVPCRVLNIYQVHRIPGAYSRYSIFEWGLIVFDILFDSLSEDEFTFQVCFTSVSSL